jgi:two-component system sensor histidine kinase PrrB
MATETTSGVSRVTEITLAAALLSIVVVALSGLVIAIRIDHQDRAQVDRQLRERAAKVQTDSGKATAPGSILAEDDKTGGARNDSNLLAGTDAITRVLAGDRIVVQRGEGIASSAPVPARLGLSTVTIDGRDWRSLVQPTSIVPNGRLQVLQSLAPVQQRLQDNGRLIALVALTATLTSAIRA